MVIAELEYRGYFQPVRGLALPHGDSSGSPGNATINAPCGFSAVALGQTTVVITNNHILSANDKVFICPTDLDATLTGWKVTRAAGSFTLIGNAAATANWAFMWFIIPKAI